MPKILKLFVVVFATLFLREINDRLDPTGESRREVEELAGEL